MSTEEISSLFLTAFQNKVIHISSNLGKLILNVPSAIEQKKMSISNFSSSSKFEKIDGKTVQDTIFKIL